MPQEQFCAGVVENIGYLGGLEPRIDGHSDRAGFETREVAEHQLRAVQEQQRDAISLPDSLLLKRRGHPVRQGVEFAIGPALFPKGHRR